MPFSDLLKTQGRSVAQSGSAFASGAKGRGFKSLRSDHSTYIHLYYQMELQRQRIKIATVAQLDRALASEAEGCWFDPSQSHQY